MEEKKIVAYLVDPTNGEILNNVYEGDKIQRKQSTEYFKKQIEWKESKKDEGGTFEEWAMDSYFKGNINELKLINDELSMTEAGFLHKMIPYINYKHCCLCHSNGKDISIENMAEITGLTERSVYRVVDDLRKKDILYKGKNSEGYQFYVNPWLFIKGDAINVVLKNMFKHYEVRHLPSKKKRQYRKWTEIGV